MGRTRIVLDPPGYYYASEPGASLQLDGAEILKKWQTSVKKDDPPADHKFFNPKHSPWLMCRPRQFSPRWFADSRLDEHVVTKSLWQFASGVTATEYEGFTPQPGEIGFPKNKWISVACGSTLGGPALNTIDYSTIADVSGQTLPTGMVTIARCTEAPISGVSLAASDRSAGYTPHFQWISYPEPHDVLVFGFSHLCLILSRETITVLESPSNQSVANDWVLRNRFSSGDSEAGYLVPGSTRYGQASLIQAMSNRAEIRSLTGIIVGHKEVFFYDRTGGNEGCRLKSEHIGASLPPGAWWIGAAPKQKLAFQAQVVGYEAANTSVFGALPPVIFDLSEGYKPTLPPKLQESALIWVPAGGAEPFSREVVNDVDVSIYSLSVGDRIDYELRNSVGTLWASDGTNYDGGITMAFTPATTSGVTTGGYASPQLHKLDLVFPPKLTFRANSQLIIYDTDYIRWSAESSLREPLGKRIQVDLFDNAVGTISAAGLDARGNYPIHIEEDTDNDGVYETLRVAGWVNHPEITLRKAEAGGGNPKQFYQFVCDGLMVRADQEWLYLPHMLDGDSPGVITHTYAVRESLKQSGFDTSSASVFNAFDDPELTSSLGKLPGAWADQEGLAAAKFDSPWGPTWEETKAEYAQRVAHYWRGWSLYENLKGCVRYHPDLMVELVGGHRYYSFATLYRTSAGAAAAGYPGQKFMPDAQRHVVLPLANIIRVTGKDSDAKLIPHILIRDARGYGADTTYENFVGEPRVYPLVGRFAVSSGAMKQMATVVLRKHHRKLVQWPVEVMLPPWRIGATGVEVGDVITLEGRGEHLLIHLETEQMTSRTGTASTYRTRLTLEKLPTVTMRGNAITAGPNPGGYPGVGVD